jgi:uncharacterized protein (DUF305 family)
MTNNEETDGIDTPGDLEGDKFVGGGLRTALLCIIAIALLAAAGAGGWIIGHDHPATKVTASSVDAGFARDMSTHHTQAVVIASYERDNTANPNLKLMAYDIESEQAFQIGEMQGWLDTWGLSRQSSLAPMSWMAGHGHLTSDGLMPGMATGDEVSHLETLKGTALDIDFLQLMIRHHQGGLPMAQYAEQHASQPYVRSLASQIIASQSSEIITMEQFLRQLGASPLPTPTD